MLSLLTVRCPSCGTDAVAAAERHAWGLQVEHLTRPCDHPELGAALEDSARGVAAPTERGRWRRLAGRGPLA